MLERKSQIYSNLKKKKQKCASFCPWVMLSLAVCHDIFSQKNKAWEPRIAFEFLYARAQLCCYRNVLKYWRHNTDTCNVNGQCFLCKCFVLLMWVYCMFIHCSIMYTSLFTVWAAVMVVRSLQPLVRICNNNNVYILRDQINWYYKKVSAATDYIVKPLQ